MVNSSVTDVLNQLIEINRDVEASLRAAAEGVNNSEIETLFAQYAARHAEFINELTTETARLDGDAAATGSLGGALQRGWQTLKSSLSGGSAASLLSACEDWERSVEVAYLNAVDTVSTGQPHRLIEKQCEEVKAFRKRLIRLVGEVKDGVQFQKNE